MTKNAALPTRSISLEGFVAALAAPEPVPGGGTAAATAGAIGAGLVAMVAGLSMDRPQYAAFSTTHQRAVAAARELATRFFELADEDAAAYSEFATAMKMPRATDGEKAARSAAIRNAARAASDVPLRTLAACRDLVRVAEALAGRGNRNASSDLAVATRLAEAAAHGAAENVRINLGSVGDATLAAGYEGQVATLLAEVEEMAESARAYLEFAAARGPETEGA